ncbi:hypothetical protein DM02DRAFT_653019 [Periconia macrospinosa]|uniref:Uncharacterized protein n=1 Tax=Periconia macrospinosa TaxID=97972 RepID=A0A2V1DYB7_9PLEO|nr:hypothetical protein DM02DRAFT_653019 [Periconia macrospinosa]
MKFIFAFSCLLLMLGWAHCEPQQTASYSLQRRISDQLRFFVPARFLDRVFTSKLPVFVKDIDHPWLKDKHNIAWLERGPDPIRDLCEVVEGRDTEGESRTIPSDIFHRLDIDNHRRDIINREDGVDRMAWVNMRDRLEEMSQCPAALQQVKYLYIDTENYYGIGHADAEVAELLADILSSMPNLERISWSIPWSSNVYFEDAFERRGLQLPRVKDLVLKKGAHYMIPICPNVEQLDIGTVHELKGKHFEATPAAKNLTSLTIKNARDRPDRGWSADFVREVFNAFPYLRHLTMLGEIDSDWLYEAEDFFLDPDSLYTEEGWNPKVKNLTLWRLQEEKRKELQAPLQSVLSALNESTTLKTVILPDSIGLAIGFEGGPGCGNAYMGPDGYKTSRSVVNSHIRAVEIASAMAWDTLPHLENITIGDESPSKVERDDKGKVIKVFYPWTDRVQEFLEEQYPKPKEYSR